MEIILFILAFIGAVLLGAIVLHHFSSIGKVMTQMSISQSSAPVGNREFLLNAAVTSGGELTYFDELACDIYSDNHAWFVALTADVRAATRTISISTYIWEVDEVSQQFFDALIDAAKRGVEVRILLDDFGNSLTKAVIERFKKNGIRVRRFHPFTFGKISFYIARNHRRSYLFDDTIAYIGGASVSKKWFLKRSVHTFTYEDVMYRFTGSAVRHALAAFGELWTAACGEVLQVHKSEGLLPEGESNAVFLNHSPRVDIHPYTYLIWYSCMVATKSILICSPYIVPGDALVDLLIRKARSGVSVTLVTQGTKEIWFVAHAAQYHYEDYLREGITIFEHQGPAHLHTKLIIIDGEWSIIGSANFDIRSQRINHETVVGIQSVQFATKTTALVDGYREHAKKIDLEAWLLRPKLKQYSERLFSFFGEQM